MTQPIAKKKTEKADHSQMLALQCVSYLIADEVLLSRFLGLTGTDTHQLRTQIQDIDFLISVVGFFIDHEPDLIKLSSALNCDPSHIVRAWRMLGGGVGQEW